MLKAKSKIFSRKNCNINLKRKGKIISAKETWELNLMVFYAIFSRGGRMSNTKIVLI